MLSVPEVLLLAITSIALILFLTNRVRFDLIAMMVLLSLAISGIITPPQAFSGFSSPAVITILSLFIMSRGLEDTGIVQRVADRLRRIGGGSEIQLIMTVMATGAALSLFMSTIAAGAVLLPAVVQVARDSNVRASKLLIPLSFGTLIGGMATYFTTANIILSNILIEQGQPGLSVASFFPTGGLITVAGLAFMALIGRRLLPNNDSASAAVSARAVSRNLYETYKLEDRLWEMRVMPGSRLTGASLYESRIGEELGLTVLAIWRGHQALLNPEPTQTIESGDFLLILGREERVRKLNEWGLALGRENGNGYRHDYSVDLTEVLIPPRSGVIGKTLTDLRFRGKYGLTSVALWREGHSYRTDVGKAQLQVGDALLMVGSVNKIKALAKERDFMVLQSSHTAAPPRPQRAPIALLITIVVLLIAILELLPTAEAMLLGAVAMALTGCISMDDAYRSVEWRVVFLIAGMLPISVALVSTGLAERISVALTSALIPYGALGMVGALAALTVLITQMLGGQVTALIVGPIAVSAALQADINPQAIAVAVAIACSMGYLTPLAHPVNILMMGPGGYTASDFLKIGGSMAIVTFVFLIIGMAAFWGIT